MVSSLIKLAKWGRASQPFNILATSAMKAFMKATHMQSEFVIKHLPRSGSVKSRLPNGRFLRLQSRGDDWVSNQVFWREWSGYEPEIAPLFFRLAARSRVTLDIGAHVGFYSLLAAHANPQSSIYAFEPLLTIYRRLQQNAELNHLTNIHCVNMAVGEFNGEADIFYGGEIPCGATLSTEIKRLLPGLKKSTVSVIALDDFVSDHALKHVDLVKIDTETTEEQVLRGMYKTLQRFHPNIICEVWGGPGLESWGGPKRILETILAPSGYRCYVFTPEGLLPYQEGNERINYLFTTLGPSDVSRL